MHFKPTEYVDISEEIDLKEKMMACHEGQIKWLMEHYGIDVIRNLHITAAFRGQQCDVPYAEALTQMFVGGRMRTYCLLP